MENTEDLDCAFQKYFRNAKRIRINHRNGVFIVVDDNKDVVDLIHGLFISRGQNQIVVGAKNVQEAQEQIKKYKNGEKVKAIIVDVGLEGEKENCDGILFAEWLNKQYPIIPFVFSTGREQLAKNLEKKFPGVDIFIKGKDQLSDLSDALGLNIVESKDETDFIPRDAAIKQQEKQKERSVFRYLRKIYGGLDYVRQ
jgi:CheY-like chemotaxis protein